MYLDKIFMSKLFQIVILLIQSIYTRGWGDVENGKKTES